MNLCVSCGKMKAISEFPPVVKKGIFDPNECKSCRHKKSQKINRLSIVENDTLHTAVKKKACEHMKKVHLCAKILCPKIKKEKLVELICPVCETHFGVTQTEYNAVFKYFGRPPIYCGRQCYYVSLTKKWQQKQSPYAKKIIKIINVNKT
jgi:hypothetical protein